jgi:hypothetical protein
MTIVGIIFAAIGALLFVITAGEIGQSVFQALRLDPRKGRMLGGLMASGLCLVIGSIGLYLEFKIVPLFL